jgi:rhamnosyltransferase
MLRAGFAKVFVPDAAVIHSHEYSLRQWLRRSFDEARALQEIYGFSEPGEPMTALSNLRGRTRADLNFASARGTPPPLAVLSRSLAHHSARAIGTLLGTRAHRLPGRLVENLSLERRR